MEKEEIQTSNSEEAGGEETLDKENLPTTEPKEEETEPKKDKEISEETAGEYWKKKFADSTREVQRIKNEIIPDLERKLEREREEREKIEREKEEFMKILDEEKPEVKRVFELEKKFRELERETLLSKEERELDRFIKENPEVEPFREELRDLGRVNPKISYWELWETRLAPKLEEIIIKMAEKEGVEKISTTPETGKGIREGEPAELDLKALRKLPLEKREKILKRLQREGRL